jgi:hypothetical protein
MSRYGEITVLNNLKVNTSKASSTAFGKNGKGKKIDNMSWWDISQFGDKLSRNAKMIELTQHFKSIYKNTDIRIIELSIDGSCDSGCIEEVRFYDTNANDIEINYETAALSYREEWNNEGTYSWDISCDNWGSKANFEKAFTPSVKGDTNEGFYNVCVAQLKEANDLEQDSNGMKWIVSSIHTEDRKLELFRFTNNHVTQKYFPSERGSENHGIKLQFPKIPYSAWDAIEDHAYAQLEGGWEINEGSQNTVQYKIIPSTNPDAEYHVEVSVEQNRNIMEVETYNDEYVVRSDHKDKLKKYIEDTLKMNTYEEQTLDFAIKKDRNKIYDIAAFIHELKVS